MAITAAMVKELRQRTGAGMMEADKKSDNTAAEGVVSIKLADNSYAIVEINSQTDFASKSEDFTGFVSDVTDLILTQKPADVDALASLQLGSDSVEQTSKALIAKIGENIQVRRFVAGRRWRC